LAGWLDSAVGDWQGQGEQREEEKKIAGVDDVDEQGEGGGMLDGVGWLEGLGRWRSQGWMDRGIGWWINRGRGLAGWNLVVQSWLAGLAGKGRRQAKKRKKEDDGRSDVGWSSQVVVPSSFPSFLPSSREEVFIHG
jgi:hypothetical protein